MHEKYKYKFFKDHIFEEFSVILYDIVRIPYKCYVFAEHFPLILKLH